MRTRGRRHGKDKRATYLCGALDVLVVASNETRLLGVVSGLLLVTAVVGHGDIV
jgi:hypothetical protein